MIKMKTMREYRVNLVNYITYQNHRSDNYSVP